MIWRQVGANTRCRTSQPRVELTAHLANPDDDYNGDADPADIETELEDRDDYKAVNAFWVPEDAAGSRTRVRHLKQIPKPPLSLQVLTYKTAISGRLASHRACGSEWQSIAPSGIFHQ